MKKLSKHDRAEMVLRRIEQYATLSSFCRVLYRAIFEWLERPEVTSEKLDQAFQLLLRCECRRHDHVGRIVRNGNLDLIEVIRVGQHARKNLSFLLRAVERIETGNARETMIRELIAAECHSHLGSTPKVIAALRRVTRLGCDHSLAYFALGYNLYQDALRNFAKDGAICGEPAIERPVEFVEACQGAIRAFQRGLGLGEARFDAQISWWIGLANETIGDHQAAREAFKNAMAMDPKRYAGIGQAKMQSLSLYRADALRRPAERVRLDRLGSITEEEISRAREFLAALNGFPPAFVEDQEA